jgi:hypothetical protein
MITWLCGSCPASTGAGLSRESSRAAGDRAGQALLAKHTRSAQGMTRFSSSGSWVPYSFSFQVAVSRVRLLSVCRHLGNVPNW